MADSAAPAVPKNVFDFEKLTITTQGSTAKLKFGIYNNNPRVVVYTNDKNDKQDYGRITAALDPYILNTFLDMLAKVANSKEPVEYMIDNKGHEWANGQRSEELTVLTTLRFGKNEQGVVWLCVEKANRPRIVFEFGNNLFHVFARADGSVLPKAEVSKLVALATARTLADLYNTYLATNYTHIAPPPKTGGFNKGGNNSGGYNRGGNSGGYNRGGNGGGNNSGGYNNYKQNTPAPQLDEEDVPF